MLEGFYNKENAHKEMLLTAEDCLESLTDSEKQSLLDQHSEVVFEPGETIIKQGFVASNVLFLEEGLVQLEILNDGRKATVSLVSPKSFIGIICTFAYHNVDFTAVALERSRVSVIDMDLFERFIKQNGEFACRVVRHMSILTNRLLHQITRVSQKNIEGALALILLEFAEIYHSHDLTLPVNRKELAVMLGYSKESVINTLSRFNREGILEVHDRKIRILKADELKQISKTS